MSKYTVMKALGMVKGLGAYVPKDNHKYTKRAEDAAERAARRAA